MLYIYLFIYRAEHLGVVIYAWRKSSLATTNMTSNEKTWKKPGVPWIDC